MFNDNDIPKTCRYAYARVSSKSQEENSPLESIENNSLPSQLVELSS